MFAKWLQGFAPGCLLILAVLAGCAAPETRTPVDGWTNPQGTPASPEPPLVVTVTPPPTVTPTGAPTETATQVLTSATPTLANFPTPVPGWVVYQNDYLGYRFNYPLTATVHSMGFGGMPTDLPLPPGFTFDEYFHYAEEMMPSELCVSVENGAGSLTIMPPYDSVGSFVGPCPGMGIGSGYRMEPVAEHLWVAGAEYDLKGNKLFWESSGEFDSEFYSTVLNNGFRVTLIGMPPDGMAEEEYAARRQELFEILMTLSWTAYPDLTLPGFTCAGRFTRLMPSLPASVWSESGAGRNLHAEPDGGSPVLRTLEQGAVVKVLKGPVCTQEQVFWLVTTPGGDTGWMAEGDYHEYYLQRTTPGE